MPRDLEVKHQKLPFKLLDNNNRLALKEFDRILAIVQDAIVATILHSNPPMESHLVEGMNKSLDVATQVQIEMSEKIAERRQKYDAPVKTGEITKDYKVPSFLEPVAALARKMVQEEFLQFEKGEPEYVVEARKSYNDKHTEWYNYGFLAQAKDRKNYIFDPTFKALGNLVEYYRKEMDKAETLWGDLKKSFDSAAEESKKLYNEDTGFELNLPPLKAIWLEANKGGKIDT